MAGHLEALGVTCVEEMVGKDPEALYTLDQARFPGEKLDRCCLYVYRLAVAFAEGRADTAEKQKWWYYKD